MFNLRALKVPFVMIFSRAITAAITIAAPFVIEASLVQPAQAQWGVMYPDGSIRNRGVLVEGPNPGRILNDRLVLPINRGTIDLNSGSISRGNVLVEGPNPGRRIRVCMQTGLCY